MQQAKIRLNAETEEEIQQVAAGVKPGSAGDPGKTLPGNVKTTDGMEVPVERPTDKDERDECYSGKKKRTTRKSTRPPTPRGRCWATAARSRTPGDYA